MEKYIEIEWPNGPAALRGIGQRSSHKYVEFVFLKVAPRSLGSILQDLLEVRTAGGSLSREPVAHNCQAENH